MPTVDSSCSNTLNFYPPANLDAIRSTLLQRIYQKRQETVLTASSPTSVVPSTTRVTTVSLLEHGLPSPPVEYEKKKPTVDFTGEQALEHEHQSCLEDEEDDAVSTISCLPPTTITTGAPDASSSTSKSLTAEQVELIIKQLKEEKHRLFLQMKNLLQQPQTTNSKNTQRLEKVDKPISIPSPSPSPTTTPKPMPPFKHHSSKPYYQPRRRRSSTSLMSPNVIPPPSSRYMMGDGRARHTPYGAYFPPPGYNVRHHSVSNPRSFRPSRFLVNRHMPRYR